MRICFVTLDYWPKRSSGMDVYGETLVRGLVAHGHEVHVICRGEETPSPLLAPDGALVHRVPVGRLDWISYARRAAIKARQLYSQGACDLVHFADVHFAYAYHGPYIATLHQSFRQRLGAHGGVPASADARNLLTRLAYYTTARYLAERPTVCRAQQLIAVSRTTACAYLDEYHSDPARIAVVRNGIDTDRFAPITSGLRQRLDLEGQHVLLFVGFCTPRKGLEYLAAALTRLPEDVHLVVAGRWEARYRRRVYAALGDAAARFHEVGYVPDEELPAYYSMADLFVSPSLLEGFGLPIAEALACGTPVVATTAGACPEVVGPGGLVVPPMDADALALAVNSLLQQPERRAMLGQLGRSWARRALGAERMVTEHIAVYDRVLASPR